MRRLMTDRIDGEPMAGRIDDDSWIKGILEPIFLLLILAIVAALVGLI